MASNGENQPAQDGAGQALANVDYAKGQMLSTHVEMLTGESDFDRQDLSIPFLRLVQGLSPYVTKGDPKFTKEADTGMIVETVTPRFFDGVNRGLIIVPVMYQRSYTEWAPNRGGLIADHGSDPSILQKCKTVKGEDGKTRILTPDGNEIAEAAQYFVLYGEPPLPDQTTPITFEQAILMMAGTQWKKSRDWNTNMERVKLSDAQGRPIKNPLPFAMAYHFTSVIETRDKYTFFGWKIKPYEYTLALEGGAELVRYANEFRQLAKAGRVQGVDDGAGGVSSHANGDQQDGDPIPF